MSYNRDFYNHLRKNSQNTDYTAKKVYRYLEQFFRIDSVCDVGCGVGSWLAAFQQGGGYKNILGIDGYWVDESQLLISKNDFIRKDLNKPVHIGRKFDLVQTLEVAEHLKPERAESFAEDLIKISDAVLFSAAIPGQGGIGHINEQWPSYWISIFEQKGYAPFDIIRPLLWNDRKITELHYRQNLILFVNRQSEKYHTAVQIPAGKEHIYNMVLPEVYSYSIAYKKSRTYQLAKKISWISRRIRSILKSSI